MSVGLISDGGYAVTLNKTILHATFLGGFGACTLTGMYRNDSCTAINTRYICPLPDNGQVLNFTAVTGQKVITSSLLSREKVPGASTSKNPYFEARVGKVLAERTVRTELQYICSFSYAQGVKRIKIPLALPSQLYEQVNLDDLPGSEAFIEGEIQYYGYGTVEHIKSSTHQIKCLIDENRACIKLRGSSMEQSELVLEIHEKPLQTPYVLTAEDLAAYSFLPDFSTVSYVSKNYLFLLDLTELTAKELEQAKTAMAICVRALHQGDRFNIYAIGEGYFSKDGQPADDIAFEQLQQWMRSLKPHMGKPCAFEKNVEQEYQIQILITNGKSVNIANIQKAASGNSKVLGFYVIGVSSFADRNSLSMLAAQTGGRFYIPQPWERLDETLIRLFNDIAAPSIDNGVIIIDNTFGSVYPKNIERVFLGEQVETVARMEGEHPGELTFRAEAGGVLTNWKIPFQECKAPKEALELLIHKRMLDAASIQIKSGKDRTEKRKQDQTVLSLESGIPSDSTAMLLTYRSGGTAFSELNALRKPLVWANTWPETDSKVNFGIKSSCLELLKTQSYNGSFTNGQDDTVGATAHAVTQLCMECPHPEWISGLLLKSIRFLLNSIENDEESAQIRPEVLDALDHWYGIFQNRIPVHDEISQKVLALLYLHRLN